MSQQESHVFYANQLYKSWPAGTYKYQLLGQMPPEIYNGGYIFDPSSKRKWFRCDLTPVLDEDVPLELKALCLLMGLSF